MSAQYPKYWYFPTSDPNVVIRCEFNSVDNQYNKNCTPINISDVPQRVAVEMTRFSNAITRYV